jgi:hypothetical protein
MNTANLFARSACAIVLLAAAATASAQRYDVKSPQELAGLLRENLPFFLKGDTRGLVENILAVELAPPLRSTFKPDTAVRAVFGDASPITSPDCRRTQTPVGERDPDECAVTLGQETGNGQYRRLAYSKNLGFGNIRFLLRDPIPQTPSRPDALPTARMSDKEAAAMGIAFLHGAFGMPAAEIPSGLPWDLSVRSLAIQGLADDARQLQTVVLHKTLFVPRTLALPRPIVDPGNAQQRLERIRAPGKAQVSMNDQGITGAAVHNWIELMKDPKLTADAAKSTDQLIEEIAEDLFSEGVRQIENIAFTVEISADSRGRIGLLLPAVQVSVSPVSRDPKEDEQVRYDGKRSTGGVQKLYSLVNLPETEQRN